MPTQTLTFTNETEILFSDESGVNTDVFTGAQLKAALQLAAKLGVVAQPTVNRDMTTLLYRGILNREADAGGRDAYQNMFNSKGGTVAQVAAAMLDSEEYKAMDSEDDDALVARLYTRVLARSPTGAELAHLKSRLQAGTGHIGIAALIQNGAR